MNFKNLLLILLVATVGSIGAQDIHFSQFYMAPLDLNPAMTGVMNCNIRVSANYRSQWASVIKSNAYSTYNVSYDQRIPVGRHDYFGVGGTLWGDRAGSLDLGVFQGRVSGSYAKRMGGYRKSSHYLVFGVEAGFGQRRIDFTNGQFGSQHNGDGGFDPTAPNLETGLTRDNYLYPDFSAGLLWFSVLNEQTNFFVGAAYHHLNQPNMTFLDGSSSPLYSKFTIHGGGEFMLSDRVGLIPGLIFRKQGPSFKMVPGASVKFVLGNSRNSNQSFQLGTWYRISNSSESAFTSDAFILSTRFDYENFTFGFSYDVNVSALQPASNANGAFEFALQYKICGPQRRGVYCPNF